MKGQLEGRAFLKGKRAKGMKGIVHELEFSLNELCRHISFCVYFCCVKFFSAFPWSLSFLFFISEKEMKSNERHIDEQLRCDQSICRPAALRLY